MYSVFVINLDKDTERMQFMHEQLTSLNIQFKREVAVLGKLYQPTPEEYDENLAVAKGGHALIPGEIGCALSHSHVLQKIVSEKVPYTLVLEDDVVLPENFKDVLEREIERNKNQDRWDYLLFDYTPVGRPFLKMWFKGIKNNYLAFKKTSPLLKVVFIFKHIAKAIYIIPISIFEAVRELYKKKSPGPVIFFRPVYFAGAYLVTLAGAEKLLSLSKPVVYTADHLPNVARKNKDLVFRVYSPLIVSQDRYVHGSSILELTGTEVRNLYDNKQ